MENEELFENLYPRSDDEIKEAKQMLSDYHRELVESSSTLIDLPAAKLEHCMLKIVHNAISYKSTPGLSHM